MNSKKIKAIFSANAFFLVLLACIASTNAYVYDYSYSSESYPIYYSYYGYDNGYNNYDYYDHDDGYNMPIILGPYPRQYLWHPDSNEDSYNDYYFDDFHGYDSFIGYKDLDIYYPDGTIEVIRNTNSRELPAVDNPEGYKTFGSHVYGYIPGPGGSCLMYKKHYGDDHDWSVQSYNYNYGYNYYASNLAYRITPTATRTCQPRSICQLTHNCC